MLGLFMAVVLTVWSGDLILLWVHEVQTISIIIPRYQVILSTLILLGECTMDFCKKTCDM